MGKQILLLSATFFVFALFLLAVPQVGADVIVANSQDWSDAYSITLRASLDGIRGFFLNSDAVTSLTKMIAKSEPVRVYESSTDPFINNLHRQLSSVGYDAVLEQQSDEFNIELDPGTGKYFVISDDNPRISLSLAALAVKENAWVFIVDEDNLDDVVVALEDADSVVGVGNFRRALLEELEPLFTERINNNDIFVDSQELARRYGLGSNVVLADGQFLEMEFFETKSPVLVSGHNKILEDTYEFLEENDIESVVVVGNELAVVGEQIRTRSNREISVFVKFGQSDTSNSGRVYALTMYPLPKQTLALTVQQAVYDPQAKELVATFKNLGNAGIYMLSTITVKNDDAEIGTASDQEVVFIGAGETLPVRYPVILPADLIGDDTNVEFYTSFGISPTGLDAFLTMKNRYGPPFSLPLTLMEIEDDGTQLFIEEVAYYKNLKRVGVTVFNNGSETTYYSVKVTGLIVNGLEENLFKEDDISPGQTKTTYIPVELDAVDLQENEEFDVFMTYGADQSFQLKSIKARYPFKVTSGGGLTGFVTGTAGTATGIALIVLIVIIVVLLLLAKKRKRGNSGAKSSKNKNAYKPKKTSRRKSR